MPRPRKIDLPQINQSETVGNRIAKLRKLKGMTQNDLGDLIGISRYQVSDYEIGRLHLSDEMLIRFSNALNTSADFLLGIENDTPFATLMSRVCNLSSDKQEKLFLKFEDLLKVAEEEK